MAGIALPMVPIWGAFPPEINTSRLQAGAGSVPMMQAAAGWEALALSLETQADELASSLASLAQMWQGQGSEQAIAAAMPMVIWLRMLALQALKRGLQATAQAGAWDSAATTTPQLVEIEVNHITNAVLNSTNFMGVNAVPIGMNEADYVRMWNTAAAVMFGYEGDSLLNSTFEAIPPHQPIVVPGGAESALAVGMAGAAPGIAGAVARDVTFAKVSGVGKVDEAGQKAGRLQGAAGQAEQQAESQAQKGQSMQQGPQMAMQMASQLGSTLTQAPQQLMQGVTQPFQQLTQPLQQMSSLFGQMGGDKSAQVGMIGATPFSNHPAIGGSGSAVGSGLIRAASLPGAGGTAARTPLMSNLVAKEVEATLSPVAVGAGAGPGAGAGLAPVGGGSGTGGGGPMGMMGQRGKSGGSRAGLIAPAPLEHDLSEDDEDDW